MTLKRPSKTPDMVRDSIDVAVKLFDESAYHMMELIERIKEDKIPSETDLRKTTGYLAQSAQNIRREGDKFREEQRQHEGYDGEYALDLAAAKREIGRKLDRLRRAQATD